MSSPFDINVIKLNSNGDWDLNGFVSDSDAVNQSVKTRLSEMLGNCFFDMDAGIDVQTMADQSEDQVDLNVRRIIQETLGVKSVVLLSKERKNGTLTLNYAFDTIFSTTSTIAITA